MAKKYKLTGTVVAIIFLVAGGLYMTYDLGIWRFNYPSAEKYPIQGLDVSHHQGDINWGMVPKDRFQFVYIKATEGGDFKDQKFQENWMSAQENGFRVGAYHFFTLCRDGVTQAENFSSTVPKTQGSLPPVVDLEFAGNCSKRPSKENFIRELQSFVEVIERRYKVKPVFYTTHGFYRQYLKGTDFENFSFWIRDIWGTPADQEIPGKVLWQYADNARVPGISGPVDLNVSYDQTGAFGTLK